MRTPTLCSITGSAPMRLRRWRSNKSHPMIEISSLVIHTKFKPGRISNLPAGVTPIHLLSGIGGTSFAFGCNAAVKDDCGKIYRVKGKTFSGEVDFEHGNFDYLMGADVDQYDAEVRQETLNWGKWFVQTTGVNGFRLDAVKHIPHSFFKTWMEELRAHFKGRELFAVGEYWTGSLAELQRYAGVTDGTMRLFDVPLHYKFHAASKNGHDFDLSKFSTTRW